jgi:hypothetical protein
VKALLMASLAAGVLIGEKYVKEASLAGLDEVCGVVRMPTRKAWGNEKANAVSAMQLELWSELEDGRKDGAKGKGDRAQLVWKERLLSIDSSSTLESWFWACGMMFFLPVVAEKSVGTTAGADPGREDGIGRTMIEGRRREGRWRWTVSGGKEGGHCLQLEARATRGERGRASSSVS